LRQENTIKVLYGDFRSGEFQVELQYLRSTAEHLNERACSSVFRKLYLNTGRSLRFCSFGDEVQDPEFQAPSWVVGPIGPTYRELIAAGRMSRKDKRKISNRQVEQFNLTSKWNRM